MHIMNSWLICLFKLVVIQTAISEYGGYNENCTVNKLFEKNEVSRTLSRRKRFILFPEGSSFQLVFCTQQAALIPIGDIFLYGSTIALAWALPTDPKYLYMFKEYEMPLRRNDEITKTKVDVPHKRIIVNPVFAKRSIEDNKLSFKEKLKVKIDRNKMHERLIDRDYLKADYMDKDAIEFHRSNRLEIYQKLETLFTAHKDVLHSYLLERFKGDGILLEEILTDCTTVWVLMRPLNRLGGDGRQCVLYKLCEAAQRRRGQGTFLQEFLTVVFTLPKGEEFQLEEHKEYDAAHTTHTTSDECITRYPGCVQDY